MLTSNRIFLRAIGNADIEFVLSIENDSANWLVSNTHSLYSKHDIEQYISSIQSLEMDKQYRWIICLNKSEKAIGAIDLFEFDQQNKRAGIGIIILEEYRRNGYASESLELLTNYAFTELGLVQLWANILKNNTQSIKLFEKQGFLKSGSKKKWILHDAQWIDMYFYQLMNKEINL